MRSLTVASPADAESSTSADLQVNSAQYGIEFLRQIFVSELNHSPAESIAEPTLQKSELEQAEFLFRRWNDSAPIDDDAPMLVHIARHHSVPEIAMLAEQLLTLENAKHGRVMHVFPDGPRERSLRLAALALTSDHSLNDLHTASAVTVGIISFLSAVNISDSDALSHVAEHLPGPVYHSLWITHLFSATTAGVSGNIEHAAREWTQFERRVPRFLPMRLRNSIANIGAALRGEDPGTAGRREAPFQFLAYFSGKYEKMHVPSISNDDRLAHATNAVQHDLVRLISSHLDAQKTENPAQLMRVADELTARELWAPAAYALQEARAIFLRRRAAGSVTRCDEQLQALETVARSKVGWFSLRRLDSTPRISLTPRQLDAARLAARGLSNSEIAEQIRCSVRTVESHLAAARAKLGATARADIARAMHEYGLLQYAT